MKLYRKIDIYVRQNNAWQYVCTTQRAKTCKEAKAIFADKFNLPVEQVSASFVPA